MSRIAAHPLEDFSLPSGGVILKSSDGVEFKVYKNILALASPFFRQMFTLPQSNESSFQNGDAQGTYANPTSDIPVIDVPESSSTLDILLRLIYPVVPPQFPGVSECGTILDAQALVGGVESVLEAALKYDMPLIVKELCEKLLNAADTTLPDGSVVDDSLALRIFVLACRHGLKEEARRAAHASLKGRVTGVFLEDFRHISAAQYFHLIQFHQRAVAVADSIVQNSDIAAPYTSRLTCSLCSRSNFIGFASWWNSYVDRAQPLLHQSPQTLKIFKSEFLKEMFRRASMCRSPECQTLSGRWFTIAQYIKESIDKAVVQNDIDLSEV